MTDNAKLMRSAEELEELLKSIIWAADLPKARSGKIMRRLLRDIADGREPGDVTTLGDPSVLRQLQERVAARGKSKS
jgi:acetyl-CoA synthetase